MENIRDVLMVNNLEPCWEAISFTGNAAGQI